MNRLSKFHKEILNSLANIYATETSKKRFSKNELRKILIRFNWNKTKAIEAIENDDVWYMFVNE